MMYCGYFIVFVYLSHWRRGGVCMWEGGGGRGEAGCFANRTYCSPDPKKISLLSPLLQQNKRKFTLFDKLNRFI